MKYTELDLETSVFQDALKLFFSYRALLSPILYAKIGET